MLLKDCAPIEKSIRLFAPTLFKNQRSLSYDDKMVIIIGEK